MTEVIVIGGGWAGCAAALAAAKKRKSVVLLERTDHLLGTGLVGGIMRNNGRFTAAEELIAMGAFELFVLTDKLARHKNIDFPGHSHATLYDVYKVEPEVRKLLEQAGVQIKLFCRVVDVELDNSNLDAAVLAENERIRGKVFVDATGTAGPMSNCSRYGQGCVMCIYRCPAFGPRVSLAAKSGVIEPPGLRDNGMPGVFSGSCELARDSLSFSLRETLDKQGIAVVPLPQKIKDERRRLLKEKACQQYVMPVYAENLILLDTGAVKMMSSFLPLDYLRILNGLENARYVDPYAGGQGNSVRFTVSTPHDRSMRVQGAENLFCAGEKASLMVGHTEAIITGTLAGFNAAVFLEQNSFLSFPSSTAVGAFMHFCEQELAGAEGRNSRYTFSGSLFWDYMRKNELYTTNVCSIRKRIREAGLDGIFNRVV